MLEGVKAGGDASASPELSKSMESFRFLTPLKADPAVSDTGNVTKSLSYRITYTSMNCLLVAGGIFLFAHVVRAHNRKAPSPGRPVGRPPQPPSWPPKPPAQPPPVPPDIK